MNLTRLLCSAPELIDIDWPVEPEERDGAKIRRIMSFKCAWGCADGVEHENAWECPKYSQKLLGALQAIAQKLDKSRE
jgi:hypothetical protein